MRSKHLVVVVVRRRGGRQAFFQGHRVQLWLQENEPHGPEEFLRHSIFRSDFVFFGEAEEAGKVFHPSVLEYR